MQDAYDSPTDDATNRSKLILENKILDFDVRRTISEFGCCFCSGSKANWALRCSESVEKVQALLGSLN